MVMSWILLLMLAIAVICGSVTGRMDAVSAAAMEGAGAAFTLALTMGGTICLWSGVMELLRRSGASEALARLFRPLLRLLLPQASRDSETLAAVSANVSANLLGLGSAATPLGLRAVQRMSRGLNGVADDEICRFVILNTASIELLPTTVCALRAAEGSANPFDILPAVWISSVLSVAAGLLSARLLQVIWRR